MIRLISAHIDNFGTLSDLDLDFDSGLNVLCRENGWGKSTFAAFLQIMFYGLEGNRKKSLEDRDRDRYRPWQGGTFGGRLRFLHNGREYEITRIFGGKESEDFFELRDASTNLLSDAFDKNIGKTLFGIDKESFLRTVFIGQNNCAVTVTDDIRSMVGGAILQDEERLHYDKALKDLKDLQNKLSPDKKTGSLYKRRQQIREEEYYLVDEERTTARFQELTEERSAENKVLQKIAGELKDNRQKLADAAGKRELTIAKRNWEALRQEYEKASAEAAAFRGKLPGYVPDLEQIGVLIEENSEQEKLQNAVDIYMLTDEEESTYEDAKAFFAQGVPTDGKVAEMLDAAREYYKLTAMENAVWMTESDRQKLSYYKDFFGDDSESVTTILAGWNLRNTKLVACQSTEATIRMMQLSVEGEARRSRTKKVLAVLSALVGCGAGIALILLNIIPLGIAAIVLGILLTGILLFLAGKVSPVLAATRRELAFQEKMLREDRAYVEQCDGRTENYLLAHGYTFEEDSVTVLLQEIAEEYTEYKKLTEHSRMEAEDQTEGEIERHKRKLEDFLMQYGAGEYEDYTGALYSLREKKNAYELLYKKEQNYLNACEMLRESRNRVEQFIRELGFEPAAPYGRQLIAIRDMTDDYLDAENVRLAVRQKLDSFGAAYDTSQFETPSLEEFENPEELNARYLELTAEREAVMEKKESTDRAIEETETLLKEMEERKIRLSALLREQEKEEKQYRYVCLAGKKLREAGEAITARYTGPVLKNLMRYLDMIDTTGEKQYHLDANFGVSMEACGAQRTSSLLSAGYKDMIGVCLRVSLADAMYKEEKPMLILDDPFTNLDDEKISGAKAFLEELAKRYQILYFTCSSSRK